MRKNNLLFSLATLLCLATAPARTEVVTDGSMGPAASLAGPDFLVSEDLGTRVGPNLFHSFDRFSVYRGESATFTGSSEIGNVISRVTGGETSNIDGTLRSQIGNADFYFINPAGVMIGKDARVDVPAAFHVSGADELHFADGGRFSASKPDTSALSVAAPEAFGFLGGSAGKVSVHGARLSFGPGTAVSFSGGEIEISDATLNNEAGEIRLLTSQQGSIGVASDPGNPPQPGSGKLSLHNSSIDVSGEAGGRIEIGGGEVSLSDSGLDASNTGATDAPEKSGIYLAADSVRLNAGSAEANSLGSGQGPRLAVIADNVAISNGASVASYAQGSGQAGAVLIDGKDVLIEGEGDNQSRVSSDALEGSGDASGVLIRASNQLTLSNGAYISSDTRSAGNSLGVVVEAGALTIDGGNPDWFTGISSEALDGSSGDAGVLNIESEGHVAITGNGLISSGTAGTGNAGNITIIAGSLGIDGSADIDDYNAGISSFSSSTTGNAGNILIQSQGPLRLSNGGHINTSASNGTNAGVISIEASSVALHGNGNIQTGIESAAEGATGDAGGILIASGGDLLMDGGATISANLSGDGESIGVIIDAANDVTLLGNGTQRTDITSNTSGEGAAGVVSVTAGGTVLLRGGGAQISSDTEGAGDAGTVQIIADRVLLDGVAPGDTRTSISSDAKPGSGGDSGLLSVQAQSEVRVFNGAAISIDIAAAGNGGDMVVRAPRIIVDGGGQNSSISSNALADSSGNGGHVILIVPERLEILDGGQVVSDSLGSGRGGDVDVSAGDLLIDGRGDTASLSSNASDGTGDSGIVRVAADNIEIRDGGILSSDSFSAGRSGLVTVYSRNNLTIDGAGNPSFTGISSDVLGASGDAGKVEVGVVKTLTIANDGRISSDTYGDGNAGDVDVTSATLIIQGGGIVTTGISSNARSDSSGDAGRVLVTSSLARLENGGSISSFAAATGEGGDVQVTADNLIMNGETALTYISSTAVAGSSGNAGEVLVTVNDLLLILRNARIVNDTQGSGNAGPILVTSGQLLIDGAGIKNGISSDAISGSEGNAGDIRVEVTGEVHLENGGSITSDSRGEGNAGNIKLAANDLTILSNGVGSTSTRVSSSAENAGGNAGSVLVTLDGDLVLRNGASIRSDTINSGTGGVVLIQVDNVLLDGNGAITEISSSTSGSSGDAGSVNVLARGDMELSNAGVITSESTGLGDSGGIHLQAKNLYIEGSTHLSGISTVATVDSGGNGGRIALLIDEWVDLRDSALVNSSTGGPGKAGIVVINAGRGIRMDGSSGFQPLVASIATDTSSGQAGDVIINTQTLDMNAATIGIDSLATVPVENLHDLEQTAIGINAGEVFLRNGALISAAGSGNVPASQVNIEASDTLQAEDSFIRTSANQADGGPIILNAGSLILRDSRVTTSVAGQGDGGDIAVDARTLVLDTGFIQANTAGANAKGGDITVDGEALLPNGGRLTTGGDKPVDYQPGLNVIQAAAPDGVSGDIALATPELDISGSLISLSGDLLNLAGLDEDPCAAHRGEGGSLSIVGRGSLPASAEDALGAPGRSGLRKLLGEPEPPEQTRVVPSVTTPKVAALNHLPCGRL